MQLRMKRNYKTFTDEENSKKKILFSLLGAGESGDIISPLNTSFERSKSIVDFLKISMSSVKPVKGKRVKEWEPKLTFSEQPGVAMCFQDKENNLEFNISR